MNPRQPFSDESGLRAEAARWTIRRDRGLSAAESIEYELWLAADERHAAAMKRSAGAWSQLDRIPADVAQPALHSASRRRSFWRRTVAFGSLAAAAALLFGTLAWRHRAPPPVAHPQVATASAASPRTLTLSDDSIVQLNAGGEIAERFTPAERRVLLVRGEAHFSVAKNPVRPFIVQAGNLQVRAVGTAFDVNLQPAGVDVIVTEGRVRLGAGTNPAGIDSLGAPALTAGQRAVLHNAVTSGADLAHALVISRIDAAELARTLSWREPLLRLGGATLAELAVEFERATGRRLVLADPSLAELRFGGRFRADDIDGFTHLLATTLDLDVEHAADGTLVLRKKN